MGNQNSSEEKKGSSKPHPPVDKDKRVNRRQSVQALQVNSRGAPADPSATNASATAQTYSRTLDTDKLAQHVQPSPSPDDTGRTRIPNRSISRRKKEDVEHTRSKPAPAPAPVNVPQSSVPMAVPASKSKQESVEKTWNDRPEPSPVEVSRYIPPSEMRPQRMPLPIAGDPAIPESPTLGPVDRGTHDVPIFDDDVAGTGLAPEQQQLRRKSSVMSIGTDQEEDMDEELPPADPAAGTVQTTIEWLHAGQRVFITGTFANWERKFKMHHIKDGRRGHYARMDLPPGTHHLMFLVDDVMMTNPDLPTAVDYNNVLVNYIEIATEDLVKTRRESNQIATVDKREIVYPAQQQPPPVPEEDDGVEVPMDEAELLAEEILPGDFRRIVPQALDDIDFPDEDPRYQDAFHVISQQQGPPSLPLFLGKAILNGQLPNKDDSSVLGLPNHTVLNHLMTSSVKNGVLATSTTTRYKKKYVTTISFKPVPKIERGK